MFVTPTSRVSGFFARPGKKSDPPAWWFGVFLVIYSHNNPCCRENQNEYSAHYVHPSWDDCLPIDVLNDIARKEADLRICTTG
jgi:hypothetical protein